VGFALAERINRMMFGKQREPPPSRQIFSKKTFKILTLTLDSPEILSINCDSQASRAKKFKSENRTN
jgi:hypothetical protein